MRKEGDLVIDLSLVLLKGERQVAIRLGSKWRMCDGRLLCDRGSVSVMMKQDAGAGCQSDTRSDREQVERFKHRGFPLNSDRSFNPGPSRKGTLVSAICWLLE